MEHDEGCTKIARVAQHAFKIHNVALRNTKIIADEGCGVNVHGQMQTTAFQNEIAENVILKGEVIFFARNAAADVALVKVRSLFASGIAEACMPKVGHFKLHGDTALASIVFQHPADEF